MKESLTNCVKKFQNGLISRRDFINKINPLILRIPCYLGYKNVDIKHEFYAYILSKIDKIISLYRIFPNVNFITWLNLVLKREFYHFISKINKNMEIESIHINDAIYNCSIQNQEKSLLSNINFSSLTEKEKDVIALKYGIKIYKRDISKSTNQILKKLDKKRNMEKTLTNKYIKIIRLQSQIANSNDTEKKTNLKVELENVKFYKRKLEKIFNSYSTLPTNKWVGEQLGISDSTIAVYLNKIKRKLLKNSCIQI